MGYPVPNITNQLLGSINGVTPMGKEVGTKEVNFGDFQDISGVTRESKKV